MPRAFRGPTYALAERLQNIERQVAGVTATSTFAGGWFQSYGYFTAAYEVPTSLTVLPEISITPTVGPSGLLAVSMTALIENVGTGTVEVYLQESGVGAITTPPYPELSLLGVGSTTFTTCGTGVVVMNQFAAGSTPSLSMAAKAQYADDSYLTNVVLVAQTL